MMTKKILSAVCLFIIIAMIMPCASAMQTLVGNVILVTPKSRNVEVENAVAYAGSSVTTYTGDKSTYINANDATVRVRPKIIKGGTYKVEMWNVTSPKNSGLKEVYIHAAGETVKTTVPDGVSGKTEFYDLGTYSFAPGTEGFIEFKVNGLFAWDHFRFTLKNPDGERLNEDNSDLEGVKREAEPYETIPVSEKNVSIPKINTESVKIYVKDGGFGDGSEENPFGTIADAQKRAREIIRQGYPQNGITIYVSGGTYKMSETLKMDGSDSGTAENPVIYTGYNGDVNIVMGYEINRNAIVDIPKNVKKSLAPDGKDNIIAVDLKKCGVDAIPFVKSTTIPFSLTGKNNTYSISKYPNGSSQDHMGIIEEFGTRSNHSGVRQRGTTYTISNPRQLRWANEANPMISGFYGPEYARLSTQLSEINTTDMTMSLKNDSWIQPMEKAEYYAYNLLSEVDSEGEFYIDTENCMLYYYPFDVGENKELFLSTNSDRAFELDGAKNVVIQKINIISGGGDGICINGDSSNCYIMGSTFCGLQSRGVVISGTNNTVRDCNFYNLGAEAIALSGGDDIHYIKAGNIAENNVIHDVAKQSKSTAINVAGCGNAVYHNYIYDVPDKAVNMTGCGNICEWNRVERACLENSDTGAIYIRNVGMGYGTIVSHNFVKDVYSSKTASEMAHGIYPDDYTCGMTIEGNVLINIKSSAICLRGSFYNVNNNLIIYDSKSDERFPIINTGPGAEFSTTKEADGSTRETRNIRKYDIYNVFEYQLAKEDLESGKCGIVRNINFKNNAIFTNSAKLIENDQQILKKFAANSSTYEGSVWLNERLDADYTTLQDLDYARIRQVIPDFYDLETEKMGVYTGGLRTDDEISVPNSMPMDFNMLSPANGESGLSKEVTLKWDDVQNLKGYYKSTVYIAESPDMSKNLFSFDTMGSTETVECEHGKTYYWTVVGEEDRQRTKHMAKNGIWSFTTMDLETVLYSKIFEAKSYLRMSSEGSGEFSFKNGAKAKLMETIKQAEAYTDNSDKFNDIIELLEDAIENYKNNANGATKLTNYIYYDFQTDCEQQMPYCMYNRSFSQPRPLVVKDPLDSLNKVVMFKDINDDGLDTLIKGYNTCNVMMSFRRQYEGKVELSASVMAGEDSSCYCIALGIGQKGDIIDSVYVSRHNVLSVHFNSDGKIYGDKNKQYPLCEYERMKWYDIKVILDCDRSIYDVYVNGEECATNIPAYEDVSKTSVGQIRFSCTDGTDDPEIVKQTGTYYLDNLILRGKNDRGCNAYLNDLSLNGSTVQGFVLDKYAYTVNMNESDFKKAIVSYEGDKDAMVSVWEKDNVKYVVVISGNYKQAVVYSIKNEGGDR